MKLIRLLLSLIIIGNLPFDFLYASTINNQSAPDNNEKWIIVLNDPRSERNKQWSGGTGYQKSQPYENSLLLKRLAKKVSEDYELTLVEQWPIKALNVHCLVVLVPSGKKDTLNKLQHDSRIKWVQKFQSFEGLVDNRSLNKTASTDIDPYRRFQTIFKTINIDNLNPQLDGNGISIAMIDSGVDLSHSDIIHSDTHYKNFVAIINNTNEQPAHTAELHGTGIASVIIAQSDNGKGISGISPAATLYAYRGCWELENGNTRCDTLSLSRALDNIIELSPDILNLSLTGPKDILLEALISILLKNGTSVVVAYDEKRTQFDRFPSMQEGIFYARNNTEQYPTNSEYIVIPGEDILAAQPLNSYGYMTGNSLSSAHLSAILALLKQAKPSLTSDELYEVFYGEKERLINKQNINVCNILQSLNIKNACGKF